MFGFAFALVPFYEKICEVTGIRNVFQPDAVAAQNTQVDATRSISVEFDANTRRLPWVFKPLEASVSVHPGEVTQVVYEVRNELDRPVTGHDSPRPERLDKVLKHVDGTEHGTGQQERRAAVEQQVTGEEHRLLGNPHHDVVSGVRRLARVPQLAAQLVGPQRQPVGERQERQREPQVAVLDVGPDPGVVRHPHRTHFFPRVVVRHDGHPGEQPVPRSMVRVMMGVDQGSHRHPGDAAHGVEEGVGPPLGGAGVDGGDAVRGDEEPGVVDHPAAVGLDICKNAVRDLLQPARDRDIWVRADAHR